MRTDTLKAKDLRPSPTIAKDFVIKAKATASRHFKDEAKSLRTHHWLHSICRID